MTKTFDRAGLLRLCSQVRPALAVNAYIPALTHIQFDGNYATAYNDVMAISVQCEPGFKACIPGETLIKTLTAMQGETVALTFGDKLQVTSGRSKINIPHLPADKHPFETPPTQGGIEITITDEVVWGIKACLFAVGTDDKQPARMGVTLEATAGKALLFSTDGVTISRATTKAPLALPGGTPIIMPTEFCEQLVSLHRAYIEVQKPTLELHPGAIMAVFADKAILYSKTVIDAEPIDFDVVLRKHNVDKAEFSAVHEAMQAAIARAMLVQGDVPSMAIEQVGKTLRITAATDRGESEDVLDYTGPDFKPFEINPVLLTRGLKSTNMVAFTDSMVSLLANTDRTFLHMIANFSPKRK